MAGYSQEVLADSPILYLRLEETSGTNCADSSTSGFVGTTHGTVTRNVASNLEGLGRGITLGGAAADFVSVPDTNALDLIGDMTYECWASYATTGGSMILMSKGQQDGSNAGYEFYIAASGSLAIDASNVVALFRPGTAIVPNDSVLHHVVVTRAGNIYSMYVDGVLKATSGAVSSTIAATTRDFTVGVNYNSGGTTELPLTGGVNEVAVYTTALSATRIAAHYAARDIQANFTPSVVTGKPIPRPTAIIPQAGPPIFQGDLIQQTAGWRTQAQTAGTKWYVRVGGANTNGGSSTSLTPERSGTDASWTNTTTTVSSATGAFTGADVGKGINLAGNRRYKIIAVTDSTHIVIDRIPPNNASGQTWAIGGAWADPRSAIGDPAINGADSNGPVVAGDVVYIGAGTYRAVYAVGTNWSPTAGGVSIIGDVTGQFTGDAGPVILTAYLTNDKTAPSATTLLNFNGKSNLTFQNLVFVGGSTTIVTATTTTSQNIQFRDCAFIIGSTGISGPISANSAYGMPLNWLIDRCYFLCPLGGLTFTLTTGTGVDYDANVVVQNSVFVGSAAPMIQAQASGALAGKGGGVRVRGCTYYGRQFVAVNVNVSLSIPCDVRNCFIVSGNTAPLSANNLGQIIDDYNLIVGSAARTNVTAGVHSISDGSYAPLFHFGQERIWGGAPRPFGEPMIGSPLLAFGAADTAAGLLDLRRGPRPSTATKWDVGAFQRGNNFTKETGTVHTGSNAISVTGEGFQDFDLAVDAGALTVSVYCRYDSSYVGPLPRMQILNGGQVGVGDTEVATTTNSLNGWVQIGLTINPTASGVLTVRLIAADTSAAGKTIFDSFAAA